MILYHTITSYHLLNAMVHSAMNEENTTIVLSQWVPEKFPNIKELESFFDEVIIVDANYRFFHSENATSDYFKSHLGDVNGFSEIYVWGAQFSMGFFLTEEHIPFVYCEEAAGLLSRSEILETIEKNDPLKGKYYYTAKKMGLYDATAENVKRILCNVSAQSSSFQTSEKVIDFNVTEELSKLPEDKCEKIVSFFLTEKNKITIDKDTIILLTQHFANLKVLSFEQQVLIYQMFVDYFIGDKHLTIKPHPDDLMYYSQLFPNAKIIREKFPAEFMPIIFEHQPRGIATISSTAIYNLRESFQNIIELDSRYEQDFEMTHRYYAAVKIAQQLKLDIICHGANEVLVQSLCDTLRDDVPAVSCDLSLTSRSCLLLVDDVSEQGEEGRTKVQNLLQMLGPDSCIVFLNSKEDYCWYNYERRDLWANIVPILLKKNMLESITEDFYASLEDEIIYVYSQNEELLTMAKNTVIDKELPHVGISIENKPLTSEQERIKMLEGILAATEKRLLYYIEKEGEKK